jgi:YVTN family beta-propeller protein
MPNSGWHFLFWIPVQRGGWIRHCGLALAAAFACGCSHTTKAPPAPRRDVFVYTSDEAGGTVAIIDAAKRQVIGTIPVGKRPRSLKLSRDARLLYVTVSGSPAKAPGVDESKLPPPDRSADAVAVVDLDQRVLVRTLPAGQDPTWLDLSADGRTVFVSNEETAQMTAVDLASGTIRGQVNVGGEPQGVTVRPDGKEIYVASAKDNVVTVVDPSTLAVVARVPAGEKPRSVVFAKDGVTAFVMDESGRRLTVLDAATHQVQGVVSIYENTPSPGGPRPSDAVVSPDGQWLYVSCGRGNTVAVVDVASRRQVRSLDGIGWKPLGIGISPDGAMLYTADGSASYDVAFTNVATGNVDKRVNVWASAPWGIAVAVR